MYWCNAGVLIDRCNLTACEEGMRTQRWLHEE